MTSNYEKIFRDNKTKYGTVIARTGDLLLSGLYGDSSHFLLELLQNAEDALRRRDQWTGSRRVQFTLTSGCLTMSHFGRPFDAADVHGICNIVESTKDQSAIGKFGIGFKSVFTFTDFPEIHSGEEDFFIRDYVLPKAMKPLPRDSEETLIILPLKKKDGTAEKEILDGLKRLSETTLLFLKEIEEISWTAPGDESGFLIRKLNMEIDPNVSIIEIACSGHDKKQVEKSWMVFHRAVQTTTHQGSGEIELAFMLDTENDHSIEWVISPVPISLLIVFFPTVIQTNLRFLIQGPYNTTPSREGINQHDEWNQNLVEQTATLLVDALRWMKKKKILTAESMNCLPLDRTQFPEDSFFRPFFDAVLHAFRDEPLLPGEAGRHVIPAQAKISRTRDLRKLINSKQIAQLFDITKAGWVSGDITQNRTPGIFDYVTDELGVEELTPRSLMQKIDKPFLEAQSSKWINLLYIFLSEQPSLHKSLMRMPLIRSSDGDQVVPFSNGKPQVFLPSDLKTSFKTVDSEACSGSKAKSFLTALGITKPDIVDDVITNTLAKYRANTITVSKTQFTKDIGHIIDAYNEKSTDGARKQKLIEALGEANFVHSIYVGGDKEYLARPDILYFPTDLLRNLFEGVTGILMVDDSYACLKGGDIEKILEDCGVTRYPRPIQIEVSPGEDLRDLRSRLGLENRRFSKHYAINWDLDGLDRLLEILPTLPPSQRIERAKLLWEGILELLSSRGIDKFFGQYNWSFYTDYSEQFQSKFIRKLNEFPWVPDTNGDLCIPKVVLFDDLGWKENSFLQSIIIFKQPKTEELARSLNIEPGVLDILLSNGITTEEELLARLKYLGTNFEEQSLFEDDPVSNPVGRGNDGGNSEDQRGALNTNESMSGKSYDQSDSGDRSGGRKTNSEKSQNTHRGSNTFVSYIGAHPGHGDSGADGAAHEARMGIEELAISKILEREPNLIRTPRGNSGYDLYEIDSSGNTTRWIEVKSMTESLDSYPIGISHAQFELAWEKRKDYWIYIVEFTTDPQRSQLRRIQDPVGLTLTYTFDRGWGEIAPAELLS